MSRILCAWSPTWAIANWRRRNPSDSPAEPRSFTVAKTTGEVDRREATRRRGRKASVAELGPCAPSTASRSPSSEVFPAGEERVPPPFALLETVRAVRRLSAVSLEAARLGLHPGQKAT